MKIKITRGRLSDALKRVSGISDGRSLPILANVKVTAQKEGLTLMTTNLDITLSTSVKECDVLEEGETTVPMKKLEQIVSVLPSEEVEIYTDANERTRLVSGGVKMSVQGLPVKEFPALPAEKSPLVYGMKGAVLLQLLRKSAYAMSRDDTRKTLQSVLLEVTGDKVNAVGTDGRRLGYGEAECTPPANAPSEAIQFVVPAGAVSVLQRIVDGSSDITIKAEGGHFVVSQCDGRDVINTKLVDGYYPNYNHVIPKDGDVNVKVDRNEMLAMLSRSLVMASASDPFVKMKFGNGTIETSATGDDDGKFHETITATYDGKEFELMFNPKYIMDSLKSFDSDVMFFNTAQENPHRPIMVKGEGEKGLSVIMPLRMA